MTVNLICELYTTHYRKTEEENHSVGVVCGQKPEGECQHKLHSSVLCCCLRIRVIFRMVMNGHWLIGNKLSSTDLFLYHNLIH